MARDVVELTVAHPPQSSKTAVRTLHVELKGD